MDTGNYPVHYAFIVKAEIDNQLVCEPRSAFEAQDPETDVAANSSAPFYSEVEAAIESQTINAKENVVAWINTATLGIVGRTAR